MKKIVTILLLLLLIVIPLTSVGYYLGIQIANYIGKLELIGSWVLLDRAPEDVEELLIPSIGVLYIQGRSGTIYYLAERKGLFEGPWEKTRYPEYIDPWECSYLEDIPAPPRDTVSAVMNCDGIEQIIITGVALSADGDLSGYFTATSHAYDQMVRGLFIITISTVTGIALGIAGSIKTYSILTKRTLGESAL